MHIAIVGAGIVGVSVAHGLLGRGYAVTLIDRSGIAAGASRGNAGWIVHTDIMPLASPKAWRHMPRWLTDPLGPLAIRPSYLPQLLPWFLRFVAASQPGRVEQGIARIVALNQAALPAWERQLNALGLAGRFLRRKGILTVWSDAGLFAAVEDVARRQRALGIDADMLDAETVRRMEPAFGDRIKGGALHPAALHVADPGYLTDALGAAALERGAQLVVGQVEAIAPTGEGASVQFADGRTIAADHIVLAAGAWSKGLARSLGDAVPLDTERGYNITMKPGMLGLSRPVMFEGHGFVTTPLDSGDRVGGSVEFGGLKAAPNYRRVDAMLARLRTFLPGLGATEGERWMGFRPSLPDSLPVIGSASASRAVTYAFGHGHHGLTQGAVTAEIVTALIAGEKPPVDVTPYSAQRFRTF